MNADLNRFFTDLCLPPDATIREAMAKLNASARGVMFVVQEGKLVGSLTDGDIRRALLSEGCGIDSTVELATNYTPAYLPENAGPEETFHALSEGVGRGHRVFPRIDEQGNVRGFALREHWGLIPISEPELGGNETRYLMDCVNENWISSSGPFVKRFEDGFSSYTGLNGGLAVSNGTVAITLALQALGISKGAEVIVPSSTFAATANAVIAAGCVPVFSEVSKATWGIDRDSVERLISKRTEAVVAVHLYGNPCDVEALQHLCRESGLALVEDCAEAIGTRVGAQHAGAYGDAATFSFFGNKTLTTGEGGMVFFQDSQAAARARQMRDHGMSKQRRYWHEIVGFNYRMTNIQAAIGLGQVERAAKLVAEKQDRGHLYDALLNGIPGVTKLPETNIGQNSYWLYPILLTGSLVPERERVMTRLASDGFQTRETFPPLHTMPPYKNFRRSDEMSVATSIGSSGICFPNSPRMTASDVRAIVESFRFHLMQVGK